MRKKLTGDATAPTEQRAANTWVMPSTASARANPQEQRRGTGRTTPPTTTTRAAAVVAPGVDNYRGGARQWRSGAPGQAGQAPSEAPGEGRGRRLSGAPGARVRAWTGESPAGPHGSRSGAASGLHSEARMMSETTGRGSQAPDYLKGAFRPPPGRRRATGGRRPGREFGAGGELRAA